MMYDRPQLCLVAIVLRVSSLRVSSSANHRPPVRNRWPPEARRTLAMRPTGVKPSRSAPTLRISSAIAARRVHGPKVKSRELVHIDPEGADQRLRAAVDGRGPQNARPSFVNGGGESAPGPGPSAGRRVAGFERTHALFFDADVPALSRNGNVPVPTRSEAPEQR